MNGEVVGLHFISDAARGYAHIGPFPEPAEE